MKKIALYLLLAISWVGYGQNGLQSIQGGTEVSNAINLYVGPNFSHGLGAVVMADLELKMFNENLTIGPTIGAGVSYYAYTETYYNAAFGYYYEEVKVKPVFILLPGVVGHYYFDWLIPNMHDKYDVFAKAKVTGILPFEKGLDPFFPVDVAVQAGGRVNMSDSFSFYGTVGYGHSYVNVGMSFKL